jgi:hypothetical protein
MSCVIRKVAQALACARQDPYRLRAAALSCPRRPASGRPERSEGSRHASRSSFGYVQDGTSRSTASRSGAGLKLNSALSSRTALPFHRLVASETRSNTDKLVDKRDDAEPMRAYRTKKSQRRRAARISTNTTRAVLDFGVGHAVALADGPTR